MQNDLEKSRERLAADPGRPEFAELAEQFRQQGQLREGLDICLRGLSANPSLHKGRLVLARIFYQLGFLPFALREVEELCRALPNSKSLKRLREKLSPEPNREAADQSAEETVAETDMDFEELDLIGEDEEEEQER